MRSLVFKAEQYGKNILESQDITSKSVNNLPISLVLLEKKFAYNTLSITSRKQMCAWYRLNPSALIRMLKSGRLRNPAPM